MSDIERVDGVILDAKDVTIDPICEVYVGLPESTSNNYSPGLDIINTSLLGIYALHAWAEQRVNTGIGSYEVFLSQGVVVKGLIDSIYGHLRDFSSQSKEAARDMRGWISALADTIDLPHILKPNPQEIIILDSDLELATVAAKVRGNIHDIKGQLMPVYGSMGIYYREPTNQSNKQDAAISFANYAKVIGMLPDVLKNRFIAEKISLGDLTAHSHSFLCKILPKDVQVSYGKIAVDRSLDIIWATDWHEALLINIAQNSERAWQSNLPVNKKQILIRTEYSEVNGQQFIDLIFEDNGPGFPDDIVANGFQEGRTQWADPTIQGTGIGMAYHAKILREHYGGDLIPEHRTDQAGNRIPGARLRIRLPIVEPHYP